MRTLLLHVDNKLGISTICHYSVVGGLSAAINVVSFAVLWDMVHVHYKIAVTISYILAILFNFTFNRHLTFKSSGRNLVYHVYRYLTMIVINYGITFLMVHNSVKSFHVSPYYGLFASIVVTALTGFLLSKFWVFKDEPMKV